MMLDGAQKPILTARIVVEILVSIRYRLRSITGIFASANKANLLVKWVRVARLLPPSVLSIPSKIKCRGSGTSPSGYSISVGPGVPLVGIGHGVGHTLQHISMHKHLALLDPARTTQKAAPRRSAGHNAKG